VGHFRRIKAREAIMTTEHDNQKFTDALIEELLDDTIELESDDLAVPPELRKAYEERRHKTLKNKVYYKHLLALQAEMIKLQDWVLATQSKVLIICEGRDSAGKGGVIKRIAQRMDPRVARVVALPKPTEREMSQWYFQRYVPHLPAGGEIVLFDRSWYNRAGVERVMGFATENQVEQFFQDVTEFEKMLVRSGIILLKYWFSISDEEQQFRFNMRIHDPMKQWKLSEMDLQARVRWEQYTKAKEEMFDRTTSDMAPWFIVEGNDKRRERLNCMAHILSQIPYAEVPHEIIKLPERVFNPDYERRTLPDSLYIPKVY
jgi:polyphosphate kinase 2